MRIFAAYDTYLDEAVKGPEGRKHYTTQRGLLLIARLGGWTARFS